MAVRSVLIFAFGNVAVAAKADPVSTNALGLRVDCLHDFNIDKGSSQNCLVLTGLRYSVEHSLSPEVKGRIRFDPFASVSSMKAETPLREGIPTVRDTPFLLVDDYALIWTPRPNLDVAAESYAGAARIPSVSGLAFANSFADTGWKQSALTATYRLAAFNDMRVKFAAGNGEGENGTNLDPQQYFGFEAQATLVQGIQASIGASSDGNDTGSASYDQLNKTYAGECGIPLPQEPAKLGYSTQRLAAGFAMDGSFKGAAGLKVGLGWQRSAASDLDKKRSSHPSLATLKKCPRLDPDTVFVEDSAGEAVNTVQRTVYGFSVSYPLLAGLSVAADYSTRRIDTGSVKLFEVCTGFSGLTCTAPSGEGLNTLAQNAVTVGAGYVLSPGLILTLEYFRSDYDKTYAQVFFPDRNGKTSDTSEVFNARIAYNWQ